MPETDVMSSLLPMLMGQGGSAEGPDPNTVGSLMALKSSPFLQGVPSQSGPMGQISQAIMPLIAAKIYGQQAQQGQQAEKVKTLVSILSLVKDLQGVDLNNAKTRMELEKLGLERSFLDKYVNSGLHGAVNGEAEKPPPGTKLSLGGLSIPIGGPSEGGELGLLRGALRGELGRDPTDVEVYNRQQADKIKVMAEGYGAKIPLEVGLKEQLDMLRQKQTDIKPAPVGSVYFDRATGDRVAKPTLGDIRTKDYVKTNPNEAFAIGEVKSALHQLDSLEKLSNELLPDYDKQANTLSSIYKTQVGSRAKLANLRAKGDPQVRAFDDARKINKIPLIASLSRTGKMPVIDTKILEERDVGDSDTKQSAKEWIDRMRDLLYGFSNNIGLDPDVLRSSGGGLTSAIAPEREAEVLSLIKGLQEQGKSRAEVEEALGRYIKSGRANTK